MIYILYNYKMSTNIYGWIFLIKMNTVEEVFGRTGRLD